MSTLDERLWAKVDRSAGPDACWPWMGYRDRRGYGQIGASGPRRLIYVHRLAYQLGGGVVTGPVICHACDNPPCCNPAHLFSGSQGDNMADAQRKGRTAAGERNHNAKLTDEDIRAIRRLHGSIPQCRIADRFGVSKMSISFIVRGITWRHVV